MAHPHRPRTPMASPGAWNLPAAAASRPDRRRLLAPLLGKFLRQYAPSDHRALRVPHPWATLRFTSLSDLACSRPRSRLLVESPHARPSSPLPTASPASPYRGCTPPTALPPVAARPPTCCRHSPPLSALTE
ncbi:hypothetical protein B0H11DRAFT_2252295 [Mycena galericulata]|nr:hypothetical protein B0H11DRAFT_2252295 [Mycena galericulata]